MRVVNRDILAFQANDFFHPIRSKLDYARVLMIACRNLTVNMQSGNNQVAGKLRFCVDKMRRLFIYNTDKYYSICFPFFIDDSDPKNIKVTTRKGMLLDSKNISEVLSIIQDEEYIIHQSLSEIYHDPAMINFDGASILEEILISEPCYIRYDYDPINENGKLHPINHFDVNYSSDGTYKIGLNSKASEGFFESFLNLNTNCDFLEE